MQVLDLQKIWAVKPFYHGSSPLVDRRFERDVTWIIEEWPQEDAGQKLLPVSFKPENVDHRLCHPGMPFLRDDLGWTGYVLALRVPIPELQALCNDRHQPRRVILEPSLKKSLTLARQYLRGMVKDGHDWMVQQSRATRLQIMPTAK